MNCCKPAIRRFEIPAQLSLNPMTTAHAGSGPSDTEYYAPSPGPKRYPSHPHASSSPPERRTGNFPHFLPCLAWRAVQQQVGGAELHRTHQRLRTKSGVKEMRH
ncbi:hypothetical protein NLG97_g9340 [Lecanicillium saksenae]|uniref:Uncharacterized protein n=1 Tax=Lecanicillium saksenae TaxID=468837 RepID=A0ACC1QGI3_9HYPO|nr:hypothetical protein NLG97_g9340 [Lecanicillium saksenae]